MIRQLICLFFWGWLVISPLATQAATQKKTIPAWLYKSLQKSEQLIANKSYGKALTELQVALDKTTKGSYEQAMVLRNLASVHSSQGHYSKATEYLSKAVASNKLSPKQHQQGQLNLGQMYMATGQYDKGIRTLEPWLAKNKADAQMSILLAQGYSQLKRYRKALPHVKRAIQLTKNPPEAWYQMNLALCYEIKDYHSAAKLLERQIKKQPDNKKHWKQLGGVYHQLKNYKKVATIQHLAYKKGLISSQKELLNLVNLLLYVHSPHQAARLLEKEIAQGRIKSNSKHWELTANTWMMAREFNKAEKALQTASKMNNKGSLYLQLGQIYVEKEQWKKAVSALNQAINKGGLKNQGNAYLLLGMSHYELKQFLLAQQAFSQAKKYKRTAKAAQQWQDYMTDGKSS